MSTQTNQSTTNVYPRAAPTPVNALNVLEISNFNQGVKNSKVNSFTSFDAANRSQSPKPRTNSFKTFFTVKEFAKKLKNSKDVKEYKKMMKEHQDKIESDKIIRKKRLRYKKGDDVMRNIEERQTKFFSILVKKIDKTGKNGVSEARRRMRSVDEAKYGQRLAISAKTQRTKFGSILNKVIKTQYKDHHNRRYPVEKGDGKVGKVIHSSRDWRFRLNKELDVLKRFGSSERRAVPKDTRGGSFDAKELLKSLEMIELSQKVRNGFSRKSSPKRSPSSPQCKNLVKKGYEITAATKMSHSFRQNINKEFRKSFQKNKPSTHRGLLLGSFPVQEPKATPKELTKGLEKVLLPSPKKSKKSVRRKKLKRVMKNVKATKQTPVLLQKLDQALSFAQKLKTWEEKCGPENVNMGASMTPIFKKKSAKRVLKIRRRRQAAFKKAFPGLATKIQKSSIAVSKASKGHPEFTEKAIESEEGSHGVKKRRNKTARVKRRKSSKNRPKVYTLNGYRSKYAEGPQMEVKGSKHNGKLEGKPEALAKEFSHQKKILLSSELSSNEISRLLLDCTDLDKIKSGRKVKGQNSPKMSFKAFSSPKYGKGSEGPVDEEFEKRAKVWALFFENRTNPLSLGSPWRVLQSSPVLVEKLKGYETAF